MITEYIREAMKLASYEKLDDGTYYGEIPGFQGVYTNDASFEACRDELMSTLE
ncbi:MAG: hypothetical protein ACK5XL_17080, partial [Cyclobacteriaceae bacterium]